MSAAGGTCDYVLDPEDPATWGGSVGDECAVQGDVLDEDGRWTCPHDAEPGEDLCIFHRPGDEKGDDEVVARFLEVLDDAASDRRRQFLGARFGTFDLSDRVSELVATGGADLSYAEVDGLLDWSAVTVEMEYLRFVGVTVAGDADFRDAEFGAHVRFQELDCAGDAHFGYAAFRTHANFGFARFRNAANFFEADVQSARFKLATFGGEAKFKRATFADSVTFAQATFADRANVRRTTFESDAEFMGARFEAAAEFQRAAFGGDAGFDYATFRGDASFWNVTFGGGVGFAEATFDRPVDFSETDLAGATFAGADLTGADFTGSDCRRVDVESAVLSRATLFGVDLRGAKLSGAVLGDVRIDDETRFLGDPTVDVERSPHTLAAIRSRQTCVYDPAHDVGEHADVDKAKSVYRALEELGGTHARPRLQARCFVRRQDLQRREYRTHATAPAATPEERVVAGARWGRATAARAILLYGESPWRVIGYSVAIVLGFALLYPLGGWMRPVGGDPITYEQIGTNLVAFGNSVYYSTLTFTALGFGDFQPVGFGRVLTTVETGLGAVLLALLVFILGRRAAR